MDYYTNVNNAENEIRAVVGGNPGPLNINGQINRCSTNRKRGDKPVWYVGYRNENDFVVVVFGDWRSGEKHKFCSKTGTRTAEETAFIKKCMEDAEQQRQKLEKKARKRAAFIWGKAREVETHPYLETKEIKAHGARLYKGMLLIPVYDKDGALCSLQFIAANGNKRFIKGGKTSGGRYLIPGEGNQIICEGFATGASIAEATGRAVVVAFNAGNFLKVAEPGMTIAGDNDAWTTKKNMPWNPGREKALTAAYEHNCPVVIPSFPDTGTKLTDFNDLHVLEGLAAVKDQISNAVLPQEFLLNELQADVGACYRPEHMKGLKLLKNAISPLIWH